MKPKSFVFATALALLPFTGSASPAKLVSNLSEPGGIGDAQLPGPGISFGKKFTTGTASVSVDSVTLEHFVLGYDPVSLPSFHVFILKPDDMTLVGECANPIVVATDPFEPIAQVSYTPLSSIDLDPLTEYVVAATEDTEILPRLIFTASEGFSTELGGVMGEDLLGVDIGDTDVWIPPFEAGHLKVGIEATPASNLPPDISGAHASVTTLWPPNGKMIPFSVQGVVDPDGDAVAIEITDILQDEPVTTPGADKSAPDGAIFGANSGNVRAERLGTGNGRVYKVLFTANDGKPGGAVSGELYITVPHDAGVPALDDGPVTGYYRSSAR